MARRSITPGLPSLRTKVPGGDAPTCGNRPIPRSERTTSTPDISWFFGENGSMDGGMMRTREASIHAGTYWDREKT